MRRLRLLSLLTLGLSLLALPAWADGLQYTGTCNSLAWDANTEADLAGYRLYDRVTLSATPTLIATYGIQITSVTCASLGFNTGQHYLSLRSYDTSGNESAGTTEQPFVILGASNQVSDLHITAVGATSFSLDFTEVDGGLGAPATYDVRYAVGAINWGSAASVSAGTCSTPVAGTTIGANKSCTVTGLAVTTNYQFQLVPYRGTPDVDAVYGPLSNIAAGTTGGGVPTGTDRLLLVTDDFGRGDGPLPNPPWLCGFSGNNNLEEVSGNVSQLGTTQGAACIYNPITISFDPDQWIDMRVDLFSGGGLETLQVGVRLQNTLASGISGYTCLIRRNGTYTSAIRLYTNNASINAVTDNTIAWVDGGTDTFRCEVHTTNNGTLIDLYRNTSSTPLISYLDTANTYQSGQVGILINNAPSAGDHVNAGIFQAAAAADACGCDQH